MSWPIPTAAEVNDRVAGAFERLLPGIDARSEYALAAVLARVQGLATYDLWLHQRALADELLPDTAVEWLERHASLWGITRNAAEAASGTVQVAGVNGTVVPSGLSLRSAAGALYTTQASGTIAAGVASLSILADTPGAAGNLAASATLDLVSPLAGLSAQTATVEVAGLTGGRDEEDDQSLRSRLLARIRRPPAGGAARDYEAWAREVAGVAYVSVQGGWQGAGTVGVIIAMDGPAAATPTDVANVMAVIDPARPVTAQPYVVAATLLPVALSIRVSPDSALTRAAIAANLSAFFKAEAAIGGAIPLSRISEAISAAGGEYSHEITSPTVAVTPAAYELPTLGTVTWVP